MNETAQMESQDSNYTEVAVGGSVNIPQEQPEQLDSEASSAEGQSEIDISIFMSQEDPTKFDPSKVMGLAKDAERFKKSASYYQSQFMKKNGAAENVNEYSEAFKPDSMYEKALEDESVKEELADMREYFVKEKIGVRDANIITDYLLKKAVQENKIDLRTDEQKAAEQARVTEEHVQLIQPMLSNLNRSKEENDAVLESFLTGKSIFTNNPEMVNFIESIASDSAMGYMFITMLTQAVEHRGVPIVTGNIAGKDEAAFRKEYNSEEDPIRREALAKAFYGE